MKLLFALAVVLTSLMLATALSACSDDVGASYYENDIHHGYPGPGTRTDKNG
ncbi:MAG TPA: hypothetical protein VM782_07600 [Stellaceae bacterium]|nr:hypothetical protein [Stellaceae bacterium]